MSETDLRITCSNDIQVLGSRLKSIGENTMCINHFCTFYKFLLYRSYDVFLLFYH